MPGDVDGDAVVLLVDDVYDDFDGLSVLFDPDALVERYGDRQQEFHTHPYRDLVPLRGEGIALGFGTHHGGTFAARMGMGDVGGIDVGFLCTRGRVGLVGWHAFTYACAYLGGRLEADTGLEVVVPPGWYRISVSRTADPADPSTFTDFEVGLEPVAGPDPTELVARIPGSNGYF